MKTKILVIVAMIMIFATSVFAQPNGNRRMNKGDRSERFMNNGERGHGFMGIPDLTDAQKTQMKKMRTAQMKEALPLRNKMQELQAHKRTISTGDNVNMAELNKTIDEIGALKTQMMKKRATHHQAVRKILTDDQRVFFDMHSGRKHHKRQGKRGKGMRRGHCNKM